LAFLLVLIDTVDNVEVLVLVWTLHRISVSACVGPLIEWVEVRRRMAPELDLRVMEVVVGICCRERNDVERASAALREVHWKTYAALQRAQGTEWTEEALIAFRGRAVLSNCLVLRFDFIVLRAYAVRRASCLLALRRLDVEVPAARSLDVTAILVADCLALGGASSSAVRRVAAIIVL